MSDTEEVTEDLRVGSLVMQNLKQTLNDFQTRAISILTLGEQWQNLDDAFARVDNSLEIRLRNLEAMKSENNAIKNRFENSLMEVELRKKSVELEETVLAERVKAVEMREKELCGGVAVVEGGGMVAEELKVKEMYDLIERKESEIEERSKMMVSEEEFLKWREKQLEERSEAVEAKEKEVGERIEGLETREKELNGFCEELKLKRKQLREKCEGLEEKKKELSTLCEGLKLKEEEVNSKGSEVDKMVSILEKDVKVLNEKENEMDELYSVLRSRDEEMNERSKMLEVKEKEVKRKCEAVELKEKEVDEKYEGLDAKEKEIKEGLVALELKESEINALKKKLEIRKRVLSEERIDMEAKKKKIDKDNEALKLEEWKMDEDRKRLILEKREWKDRRELEEIEIKKRYKELELKEKETNERLELKERKLTKVHDALELEGMQLNERLKKMEMREKEINELFRELEKKEEQIDAVHKGMVLRKNNINDFNKRVELKGEELNEEGEIVELEDKQVNNQHCQFEEPKEKENDGNCSPSHHQEQELGNNQIEKMKQINEDHEALKLKEKKIDKGWRKLKSKRRGRKRRRRLEEKETNKRYKELELKEKEINGHLELKEKKVDRGHDALVLKDKQLDESCEKMEQINTSRKVLVLRENNINNFNKGVELKGKELDEDGEIVELEDKQVDNKHCQFEKPKEKENDGNYSPFCLQEQELNQIASCTPTRVSEEPPNSVDSSSSLSSSIRDGLHSLCQNMDAHSVRSYLIEHVDDHHLLQDKILDALKCAPNSAKLILDVHKYPSKDQSIAHKNSCIFLLEQFMKLSPPITSDVKVEALSLALNWMAWLKSSKKDVDHYGFLLFIAGFKLTTSFNADELIFRFVYLYSGQNIYRQEQHTLLCNTLGLSEKIPGFIESLIERKEWLLAVKFICVFNLESDFSPMSLLVTCLDHIEERAKDRQEGAYNSKFEAVCMALQDFQNLHKCITKLKLELNTLPNYLLSLIKNLEKEKETLWSQVVKKRSSISCEEARLGKCPRVEGNSGIPHNTPDVLGIMSVSNGNIVGQSNQAPFPQFRPCNTHEYANHISPNAQHYWTHTLLPWPQETMPVFNCPTLDSLHRPPMPFGPPPDQISVGQAPHIVPGVQYYGQQGTMPRPNGHGYKGFCPFGSGSLVRPPQFCASSFHENQQAWQGPNPGNY